MATNRQSHQGHSTNIDPQSRFILGSTVFHRGGPATKFGIGPRSGWLEGSIQPRIIPHVCLFGKDLGEIITLDVGMNISHVVAALLFTHISKIEFNYFDLRKMKACRKTKMHKHRKTYYWQLDTPPHIHIPNTHIISQIYKHCFKITIEQMPTTKYNKNIYKCTKLITTKPHTPYLVGPKIYID